MADLADTRVDRNQQGYSSAARTLTDRKNGETNLNDMKKNAIKKAINNALKKKKIGKEVFDPEPEMADKDTIVKL